MSQHRTFTAVSAGTAAALLAGGLFTAFALAGCGSAQDAITERALEQISGQGIDIDIDGEDFSIKTQDGETSFSTGGDVPAAWNAVIGVMPGATVGFVSSMSSTEGQIDSVTLDISGDIDSVLDYYAPKLLAAGFTETGRYSSGSGGDQNIGATFQRDKETVNITVFSVDGSIEAAIGLLVDP